MDKLSKKNKTVFLLGDFNVDLLNYDQHSPTNELFDSLYLSLPIRSSLILYKEQDHLIQFCIPPDIFSNPSSTKLNIFERNWSKFDQENFDYLSVVWENLTTSVNGNVDQSFISFLTKINSILDMYAPLINLETNHG